MNTRHSLHPSGRHLCCAGLAAALAAPAVGAADVKTVTADPFYASLPADCGGPAVTTGLCLLASTKPLATGSFIAAQVVPGNITLGTQYPVTLNTRLDLPPGNYLLYRNTGLDSRHERPFTVTAGQLTTIKTAVIKFQDRAGSYNKLQHFQARNTVGATGCNAEIGNTGVQAYLPDNYQVTLVPTRDNSTPRCEASRFVSRVVTFNLMASQGVTLRPGTVTDQTLAAANSYRRASGAVSLTTIGPLRQDVSQVGFLSKFRSYQGVQNSSSAAPDALVLSGAPHFHFVIPVTMNPSASCGVSLAAGGLPRHNLMTDCVFDAAGRLTRFRVNAGAYYGLHNLAAKSAVAAVTINSPFIVGAVRFNLKGN
ncbi:hypothetical protein [uncultured Thiodictyon sp.]|jgi:hypothetical protein|uniref:hypothetical protein n=1 Tax=uncultured Thiodictyon sp. TaxID=1846217 RepID=UPI0025E281A4|nr:hypothetical protein [uncultured Thiodictyon sp.]